MTFSVINPMPYLRTTWDYPEEIVQLSETLNRSFLETAMMLNLRTIGLFPTNRPALGGESWYLAGQKQQNLRQIYTFNGPAPIASIKHTIPFDAVAQMTKCSGAFTDGTNWYGILFASSVVIAGQVSFYVTQTDIVILVGAGAPVITTGTIVLEWISNV